MHHPILSYITDTALHEFNKFWNLLFVFYTFDNLNAICLTQTSFLAISIWLSICLLYMKVHIFPKTRDIFCYDLIQ